MGAIKYLVFCSVLLTGIAQAQLSTSGGGGGTSDSIGVDTDGNGTVDGYIYPSFLKKGANITFTLDNDTLIIAGSAGSGTADSMGVDTNGDGTVDGYMYSTTAGAFHIKKGDGVTLTLDTDTTTVAFDVAFSPSLTGTWDFSKETTMDSLTVTARLVADSIRTLGKITSGALLTGNAGATFNNGSASAGFIQLTEDTDDGANTVTLIAPNVTTSYSLMLPVDDGTPNQVLETDGSGVTSWVAQAGASGTADSTGVDTNGDGTVDGYMYSTTAGAAHLKKGDGVLLTLDTDTTTVALDVAFSPSWTGTHDFAKKTTFDTVTVTSMFTADTITSTSPIIARRGLLTYNEATTGGFVRFHEDTDNGSEWIHLTSPFALASSYTLTFPSDDGDADEFLQTDGFGNLDWVAETGEANTLSDTGTFNGTSGFGLAGGKTGVALKVKGLIEGSNITITASGDSAFSIASSGGTGLWDTLANRNEVYLFGSADTTLRLDRDAANDTTTLSVPVGVLKIAGGTGTPVIDFNLATNFDSTRFDSMLADIRVGNWNWADSSGEPPFWVDSAKNASVADTIPERGNALLFHGGYSRHNFDVSINVSGGAAYYVIDDHDTPGDSNDIWLSNDGDGGGVVMYTVELPDSVLLTNGTATTNQENFVCYTYNSGSPALVRKASNPEHDSDGAVNDSVLYLGEVGLGAVAGGTAVIRKNNLRKSYLHKFVQRVTHANGEVHWHEDVTPSFTTPARNVSTTRGFVHKLEEIVIPASGTSLGHANTKQLIIPVYPDSAFATWDSLAGFLEYGDGGTISSTGAGHFVNLVLWGSASDADTSDFQYYLNIQNTASYNTVQRAEDDADGVTVLTIPEDFNEVGFLICRMVYGKADDSIMDLTDGSKFKDLRNPQGGGGGAGSGVVTDSATIAGWNYIAMTASAHLSAALSDETGTGVSVFGTNPTFVDAIASDSAHIGVSPVEEAVLVVTTTKPGYCFQEPDAHFGNAVEGMISIGDGRIAYGTRDTTYNNGLLDLGGTIIFRQTQTPDGLFEFVFFENGGALRFVIPKSGDSLGTLNPRSMFIAGPAVLNDSIVRFNYWGFTKITANTAVSGADLGVQGSIEVLRRLFVDTIDNITAAPIEILSDVTITGTTIAGGIQLSTDSISGAEVVVTDTLRTTILSINGKSETGDKHFRFNMADPGSLQSADAEWCIEPVTAADLTITRIDVTLDADPTTELEFSIKFADAFIGFANTVVIDDTATVAGVTTVTGGFGDATVPAGKCIFITFDAAPDAATTQFAVKITYDFD